MNSNWRFALWRGLATVFVLVAAALLLLHALGAAIAATPSAPTARPNANPVVVEPGRQLLLKNRDRPGTVGGVFKTIESEPGDRQWT